MKFQNTTLLVRQSIMGFLLGAAIILFIFALHTTLDAREDLAVIISKNPSSIFLCFLPFILSRIYYVFAKSKSELLAVGEKMVADQKERQGLLEELSDYKLALDHSAIVTVIDTKGKIKRVNNNFLQLTGCTAGYLLGRSILRLPSSLQHEKVFAGIKDQVECGNTWKGEIAYYQPGGETRYTSGIVMPLSNKGAACSDCLVIQYDITAEKNSHIALRKSESEKDAILSNTQTLICTHTFDGILTNINKAGAEVFGATISNLVGQSMFSLIDQRFTAEYAGYLSAIKEKGFAEGLMKIVAADGTRRTMFYRNIVGGSAGEQYIVGSAIDVTETLRAQKEVEDQRAFTRQILDISPNIICVTDNRGAIILSNKKFKNTFGCANDGMLITEFPCNQHEQLCRLINNPENEVSQPFGNYEFALQDEQSGTSRHFNVYRTEFTERTGKSYVLVIATDVSEKHHARLELLKAHSLVEQALKVKEQFIANMSHEIRTPLNAIIGFTDVLTETPLDFQQRDYVQTVRIAGQNLLSIINDILDLSKIEAGMISLEKKPVHIQTLVGNVKKLFEPKVNEKKIYLNVEISDDVPQFIKGDQVRINQVLINLVSNAVKFTHSGGVKVVVSHDKQGNSAESFIKFDVTDTGIGIEEEKQSRLFNRFEQGGENTHKLYGGTGLGLNISKNLVEMFGGTISVESVPYAKTTFSFTIPFEECGFQPAIEKAMVKDISNFSLNRPVKILLAEDNKTNARLATQVLTKQGFTVHHVLDGIDVVEALETSAYDLVLMDVQMAQQDGIETTRIIRSSGQEYSNIPIIALTAHSFVGEKNICADAGMNGYISKPFSPQQLYSAINKIIIEKEIDIIVEAIA